MRGAPALRRQFRGAVNYSGFSLRAHPALDPAHGRHALADRQGPGGPHAAGARRVPRGLRAHLQVPERARLPEPAADRPLRRHLRLDPHLVGHRQPPTPTRSATTTGSWRDCGIDADKLPEIVPVHRRAGHAHRRGGGGARVCRRAPRWSPAPSTTPPPPIGSGAVDDFATHLYIGTSSWLATHVPFKKTDIFAGIASVPCAVPGRYLLTALQATAGGNLTFLRDNVLYHHDELLAEERLPDVFKIFDRIAARVPAGSNGVIYTPWIYGERAPVDDRALRAGLLQPLARQHARGHRARLPRGRGAEHALAAASRSRSSSAGRSTAINLVGGGGQSEVWCQIFADVLGVEVRQVRDPIQANARGAAWIAAVGLGEIEFRDVPGLVGIGEVYAPRRRGARRLRRALRRFRRAPQARRAHAASTGASTRAGGPGSDRERASRRDGEGEARRSTTCRPTACTATAGSCWRSSCCVNLTIQMLWISYAPITSQAATYYGVSHLVDRLPGDDVHDRLHPAVAAGRLGDRHARLSPCRGLRRRADGASSASRAAWPARTTRWCCSARSASPSPSRSCWTPGPRCRPTGSPRASGRRPSASITLASLVGIAAGHGAHADPGRRHVHRQRPARLRRCSRRLGSRVPALARERPATPPCPAGMDERALMLDGLKHALTVKPFLVMLAVAFIVMSAFNGVTTWVEEIIKPRGFTPTDAGIVGGADAGRRHHRRGRALGALRPPGQARPLHGHRPRATVPGHAGRRLRVLTFCSTLSPPSSVSSSWPCCRSACSTPRRSPTPRPRARRTGSSSSAARSRWSTSTSWRRCAPSNGSFTVSLLLSAVLLVGCALAVSRAQGCGTGGRSRRQCERRRPTR